MLMPPIRVLQVMPAMDAGGMETFVMNVYRTIDREKVQFDFLYHYDKPCFFDDEIRALGGRIFKLTVRQDNNLPRYLRELRALFAAHPEWRIIHGHYSGFGMFYSPAARRAGIPVRCGHSHNTAYERNFVGRLDHFMSSFFNIGLTDRFACSEKAGQMLFGKHPFTVVPNGIDTARFAARDPQRRALLRGELGVTDQEILFGHVGRFSDQKNHPGLLKIFAAVRTRLPKARLVLLGGGDPAYVEKMQALAAEQGVPMMAVLQHAGEYAVLKSAAGKLERFAQLIAALREMADTMELAEFYDAVCEQTSYVRTLQEKGDMESRGRLENVQELKSNIVSFLENDPEDATLSGFLNEIALYTDLDSATSDNCVTMMTMHSAKGLEFPCVYVVGVEEGIFPGERVRYNDEEVEEERRLCYVAMTRAKERLTMTCTRQRMLFGRTSVSEPSRFLEEVSSENADWVGRQAQGASGFGDTSFDEGSSYSTRGYGSYGQGAARYDSVMQRRPKSQASQKLAAQKPAASAPLLQLSSGDQIHHKTFGDGLVISVTPMGGDALLEVAFDTVGTKKLMLKTAGVHITKL